MPETDAKSWALRLSRDGMSEKLNVLEIWVSEADGQILGWVAIADDRLEGLYTSPAYAEQGVGSELLSLAESLMRKRQIPTMRAVASANAVSFYLRRGFEPIGPCSADGTRKLEKRLAPA
jgi:N-acetylglutamate synthase-like GNAT family acetyltransferase